MLSTMPIPSTPAPQRPAEAPSAEAEGRDSGDAFAQLLRGQAHVQTAAPNGHRADASRREARADKPRADHGEPTAHEVKPRAERSDSHCTDVDHETTDAASTSDSTHAVDTALRAEAPCTDAAAQPMPLPIADAKPATPIVSALTPQGTSKDIEGSDEPVAADDHRTITPRAGARSAHDGRVLSGAANKPALPVEPAMPRDQASASALPMRAVLERAAGDGSGAAASVAHAPTFERPVETFTATLAALAPTREPERASATCHDAPLAQAALHDAIDDPEFGPALGHQVALWVSDGVQEARLQLHPAELGPVTVQIALDGQAAHVDFTAAVAATRDSIEQSLPALAAALRESGFTLAGGGVSSQGAGQGDARRAPNGHGSGNRSRIDTEPSDSLSAPQDRRWTRSLLDVYA